MTTYVRDLKENILFCIDSGPKIVELESPITHKRSTALSNSPLNSRYTDADPMVFGTLGVLTWNPTTYIDIDAYSGQSKESAYTARAIKDVNREVSNRMIAAASDSPPLIPKRDYAIQSTSSNLIDNNRNDPGRNIDTRNDRKESSDEDSSSIPEERVEPFPHPNDFPDAGGHRFPPFPPPRPMAMFPGPRPQGELPISMIGPPGLPGLHLPPPPPPWIRGPPPQGPPFMPGPPPMTGVYPDSGMLFAPHGPMMVPGDPPKPPKRKIKEKKNKVALNRTKSMDEAMFGLGPQYAPFPPLPPPPIMENPYGFMGPPAPYARSEMVGMPPFRLSLPAPYPRAHTECGSYIGGGLTGGSIIMGQPPLHRETKGSQLVSHEFANGKTGTVNSDSLSNPSDKKLTEKGRKRLNCREICCDSGLTTVIGVVIGLMLLGLIIGLALGLTIV